MKPVRKVARLANGLTIPYLEQGDPAGAPVLLLHGLVDSSHSFDLVLPHLPDTIHVFVPDQRGHGDASHPASGYRVRDFAADVPAFLDAVRIGAAIVGGHSSHSVVAERVAMQWPERVLGLVLIGAPFNLAAKRALRELVDALVQLNDPISPEFVREFVQGTFARPLPADFLDLMVGEALKAPARVWREAFRALMEEDLPAALEILQAPALLIWGDEDTIIPRDDQERLLAAIPGSRLVVYPGTGHSPHWEEPERFAQDVVAFASTLASA